MEKMTVVPSPWGNLWLAEEAGAITHLLFREGDLPKGLVREETPLLREAAGQLREYFSGARREFTLPLAPAGTPFQLAVWQALGTIPYGEVRTYAQMARQIGRPKAVRAMGRANGLNPISILIPCHRVVGSDGSLTGYGGGLEMKAALLALEKNNRLE